MIAGQAVDIAIFPVDHPASLALGSQPLKEETSFNFSGGVVVTPANNLTMTADYFHIEIDDRVLLGATFDDAASIGILTGAGFTNLGGLQYFTNGLDTRTQGVDVTANLRVPTGCVRNTRSQRVSQLHQERDHPGRPVTPGPAGCGLH